MDIEVTYKNGVIEIYQNAKEVKGRNDDKFLKFSTEKKFSPGLTEWEVHNINLNEIMGYKITQYVDHNIKPWYN